MINWIGEMEKDRNMSQAQNQKFDHRILKMFHHCGKMCSQYSKCVTEWKCFLVRERCRVWWMDRGRAIFMQH